GDSGCSPARMVGEYLRDVEHLTWRGGLTMPPKCSVCIHAKRADVDRMLLGGSASLRDIAKQFGVTAASLNRHRNNHLPARMAEVAERNVEADIRTAIDVVAQLKAINGVTL